MLDLQIFSQTEDVETLHEEFDPQTIITHGYTSDLLSDVMAHAKEGNLLITIQAHNNTVAVASLTGLAGILICSGRPVPEEMIAAARQERIALFRTSHHQFDASCRLGRLLGG